MKRKKTKAIPAINHPGKSVTVTGGSNKMHRALRIDKHRMAGFYQLHICRLFSDYEKFFSELIKTIPSKEIPLWIGLNLPLFVKRVFEDRLKTEIPPGDGGHGGE
jgi:hypothetical protein